jgi:carbon monoxide dehydrogenase subunit G
MELSGQQIVAAPRQAVWEALNDPRALYECIPGCEDIEKISGAETRVRVAVKLGPVRARFTGKMLMSDVTPAERCTLTFEGAGGAAGFAKGFSRVELSDEGSATKLTYSVEASVGGKLGQIGGRLIDSSAKKMADEFFGSLDRCLTGSPLPRESEREPAPTTKTADIAAKVRSRETFCARYAGESRRMEWRPYARTLPRRLVRAWGGSHPVAQAFVLRRGTHESA